MAKEIMELSVESVPDKSTPLTTKNRVHWVDIAKGIAIICVFIGHTESTPNDLHVFMYFFHMPVFFFLSGFCFSAKRKFSDFLVTKLKTIILPVFTIGLVGKIISSLWDCFINHWEFPVAKVFLSPIIQYGEYNYLWFLPAMFVSLIIFYGLVKLLKDKPVVILTFSIILGLASYCFIHFVGADIPWFVDRALVAMPFLGVGYLMKKLNFSHLIDKLWLFPISLLVCFLSGMINELCFSYINMNINHYGNIGLYYLTSFAGIVMIISISQQIAKCNWLEFFGRNTLLFYAFAPIQRITNGIITLIIPNIDTKSLIITVGVTVVSVALIATVSSVFSIFINKYLPFLIGKKRRSVT